MFNNLMGKKYQTPVALNPLERPGREFLKAVNEKDWIKTFTVPAELYFSTNFDWLRALFRISEGAPIEDETYELLGVPKSQRPED